MIVNPDIEQLKRLLPEYSDAGVKDVRFVKTDFVDLDIRLLTNMVPGLFKLDLNSAKLTESQLTNLLCAVQQAENMDQLNLSGVDISGVTLLRLKESVAHIKEVQLQNNFTDKISEIELLREGIFIFLICSPT